MATLVNVCPSWSPVRDGHSATLAPLTNEPGVEPGRQLLPVTLFDAIPYRWFRFEPRLPPIL